MTTVDFITDLFCRINDEMRAFPKHPQAQLWLSKGVTLGVLHALKGVGNRAFYRGLSRDYHPLFPQLPKHTRLLQLFVTHRWWTWRFLAQPTLLGVIDSDGIERIHPFGKGAVRARLAARASLTTAGSSAINRWIVGYKLCLWVNHLGGLVGGLRAPASMHDFADCFFWILMTPNIQSKRPRVLFARGPSLPIY